MKKFFTVVPLQVSGQLVRYHYEAVGNSRLQMDEETSFPILTAIHGYAVPGEPFQVIAVVTDTETGHANCRVLQEELEALCQSYGLTCAGVEQVVVPSDERVATHTATFQKLISYAQEDDELFACISFGTKPLSIAVRMAVQYAYKVKKNTSFTVRSTGRAATAALGARMYTMKPRWCSWTRWSACWQTAMYRTPRGPSTRF